MKAARHRDYPEISAILSLGANPNAQNDKGETPIMLLLGAIIPYEDAVLGSWQDVSHETDFKNLQEAINLLLRNGAKLDINNKYGQHALFYAASSSSVSLLKWFLKNGFMNINQLDIFGNNCLQGRQSGPAGESHELYSPICSNAVTLITYGVKKISGSDVKNMSACINDYSHISFALQAFNPCNTEEGPHFCVIEPYKKKELLSRGKKVAISAKGYLQYVRELQRMNIIRLTDTTTLYDLLFFNRRSTVDMMNNKNLKQVFKINDSNFENLFPEMGIFLNAKIFRGFYGLSSLRSLILTLKYLLFLDFPPHIWHQILFWLPDYKVEEIINFYNNKIPKDFVLPLRK